MVITPWPSPFFSRRGTAGTPRPFIWKSGQTVKRRRTPAPHWTLIFPTSPATQFLDLRVRGGNCRKIDGNSDGFSGVAANIDRLAARGKFSQKSIERVRTKKNRAKYTSPLHLVAFKKLCPQKLQYTPPPRTVVVNSDKDCRWGRKIFVKEFRLNDVRFFLDGLCYIQNIRILLQLRSNTTPPLGQFFHVLRSRQSNIII